MKLRMIAFLKVDSNFWDLDLLLTYSASSTHIATISRAWAFSVTRQFKTSSSQIHFPCRQLSRSYHETKLSSSELFMSTTFRLRIGKWAKIVIEKTVDGLEHMCINDVTQPWSTKSNERHDDWLEMPTTRYWVHRVINFHNNLVYSIMICT